MPLSAEGYKILQASSLVVDRKVMEMIHEYSKKSYRELDLFASGSKANISSRAGGSAAAPAVGGGGRHRKGKSRVMARSKSVDELLGNRGDVVGTGRGARRMRFYTGLGAGVGNSANQRGINGRTPRATIQANDSGDDSFADDEDDDFGDFQRRKGARFKSLNKHDRELRRKRFLRNEQWDKLTGGDNEVRLGRRRTSESLIRSSHRAKDGNESFETSSTDGNDTDECHRKETKTDLSNDYWQIQKLVKYLKAGNQTATVISLCALMDFNLSQESNQVALRDVGAIEIIINLLETEHIKCKIGSLRILKIISRSVPIRKYIVDFGGIQSLVKVLTASNRQIKLLAAETLANITKYRSARRTNRQYGGLKKLVSLLDLDNIAGNCEEKRKDVEVARMACHAILSCSVGKKNKEAILRAGAVPLLGKLVRARTESMVEPMLGILQACATETQFRICIRNQGLIQDFVQYLGDSNQQLQIYSANAIFRCAEDPITRRIVREYMGLEPIVEMMKTESNPELLVAVTGAVWKCAINEENVVYLHKLRAIDQLVNLLTNSSENVLVNVVGAIAELSYDPMSRLCIRQSGGIPFLINLLNDIHAGTNKTLLINVAKAIGQCAQEVDTMRLIHRSDGLRLLWSLLKNDDAAVIASAAWTICSCIDNEELVHRKFKNSSTTSVRSFENMTDTEVYATYGLTTEGIVVRTRSELLLKQMEEEDKAKEAKEQEEEEQESRVDEKLVKCDSTGERRKREVNKLPLNTNNKKPEKIENVDINELKDPAYIAMGVMTKPKDVEDGSSTDEDSLDKAFLRDVEDSEDYDTGETVRSFVGGLELIVSLLRHKDIGVLTSICAAITNISRDEENLAVITDHGVVQHLAKLTIHVSEDMGWSQEEDILRMYISETIARCCGWSDNRTDFGKNGAVAPLVDYLRSSDFRVKRATVRALYELSAEPDNCVVMHETSAVRVLLRMVSEEDGEIQEHASGVIGNIRSLAFANEKQRTH